MKIKQIQTGADSKVPGPWTLTVTTNELQDLQTALRCYALYAEKENCLLVARDQREMFNTITEAFRALNEVVAS